MHYFTACISPTPALHGDRVDQEDHSKILPVVNGEKNFAVGASPPPPPKIGTGLTKHRAGVSYGASNQYVSNSNDQLPPSYRGLSQHVAAADNAADLDEYSDSRQGYVLQTRGGPFQANRQNSSVYQSVERYKRHEDVTVSKINRVRNAKSADRVIFDEHNDSRPSILNPLRSSLLSGDHRAPAYPRSSIEDSRIGNHLHGSFHSGQGLSHMTQQSHLTAEQLSVVASIVANESIAQKKAVISSNVLRASANTSIHTPYSSSGANSFHGLSFHRRNPSNIKDACNTVTKKYRDEIASIDNVLVQVEEQIVTYNNQIADLKKKSATLKEKRQQYEDILPIMNHRIREIERIKAALFVQRSQSRESGWSTLGIFGGGNTNTDEYMFEEPELIAMRTSFKLAEMGLFTQQYPQYSPQYLNSGNQIHISSIEGSDANSDHEITQLVSRIRSLKDRIDRP